MRRLAFGRLWNRREDVVIGSLVYLITALLTFAFLYPVLYTVSVSFSGAIAVEKREIWLLPKDVTLEAYRVIVRHPYLPISFWNSIVYTVVGTVYSMLLTILGAYALSHKRLRGRGFFSFMIFFTMLFHGGLIPTYLLVRDLGLLDSFWSMILPAAVSQWNLIVMRTVLQQNPESLEESAKIDGASYFQILLRIVLPISTPVLATITLFYAVGKWNNFFSPLIYLSTRRKYPLQLIVRELLITMADNTLNRETLKYIYQQDDQWSFTPVSFRAAVIVVSVFPVLVIYPFVQRYFVKGIMVGAIKG